MQAPLLTEVPSSLKQLARLVVRGFYDIEYSLIVDMLVRWWCLPPLLFDLLLHCQVSMYEGRWPLWPAEVWQESAEVSHGSLTCGLWSADSWLGRSKLATLKTDKFLQVKLKIETGDDGKANRVNCYFINYKVFVNIVKYKLDHMRKRMETEERDATSRSSFRFKTPFLSSQ